MSMLNLLEIELARGLVDSKVIVKWFPLVVNRQAGRGRWATNPIKQPLIFSRGETAKARDIQPPLIEANTSVTSRFGVPGLKAAMDFPDYYGGPVRSPLIPPSEEDKSALRDVLTWVGLC